MASPSVATDLLWCLMWRSLELDGPRGDFDLGDFPALADVPEVPWLRFADVGGPVSRTLKSLRVLSRPQKSQVLLRVMHRCQVLLRP